MHCAPYGIINTTHDHDHRVRVVRHYDERIQRDARAYDGRTFPFVGHDVAPRIQHHRAIDHMAEKAPSFMRADGHEVRTVLRVIVIAQADGSAVVICHFAFLFPRQGSPLPCRMPFQLYRWGGLSLGHDASCPYA
jgi:hypothetical protein